MKLNKQETSSRQPGGWSTAGHPGDRNTGGQEALDGQPGGWNKEPQRGNVSTGGTGNQSFPSVSRADGERSNDY